MRKPKKHIGLKRDLGLFQTVAYGVGIILGAGIYVLIGQATGMSGNSVWISFLFAAVIASFTGLSYAELSSTFPKDAAEFIYAKKAFNSDTLSFLVGYLIIFTGIISASTVALGFAGYLTSIVKAPMIITALALIAVLSFLNFHGIKFSANINILFTLVEVGGLVLIIFLGMKYLGSVDYFEMPSGFDGVFSAAALIFFAYIGFEDIVKLGEEVKEPKKTLPKALLISIAVTTVLYILLAISAVSIMPSAELGRSKAPLADVASFAMGPNAFFLLAVIALFSTSNTVLILLISTSRMVYGMAREHSLPGLFMMVHPTRRTPMFSIALVMSVSMLFVLLGDIGLIASVTTLVTFLVFITVNVSLIWLRFKEPNLERGFRSPLNMGKVPLLAVLGILFCLFMLLQFDLKVYILGIIVILMGIVFRWLVK